MRRSRRPRSAASRRCAFSRRPPRFRFVQRVAADRVTPTGQVTDRDKLAEAIKRSRDAQAARMASRQYAEEATRARAGRIRKAARRSSPSSHSRLGAPPAVAAVVTIAVQVFLMIDHRDRRGRRTRCSASAPWSASFRSRRSADSPPSLAVAPPWSSRSAVEYEARLFAPEAVEKPAQVAAPRSRPGRRSPFRSRCTFRARRPRSSSRRSTRVNTARRLPSSRIAPSRGAGVARGLADHHPRAFRGRSASPCAAMGIVGADGCRRPRPRRGPASSPRRLTPAPPHPRGVLLPPCPSSRAHR